MKRKTVCIDLDATLAQYDEWKGIDYIGDPIPGAVEFTKAVSEFANVIIFTTRCNQRANDDICFTVLERKVAEWLDKHGFEYADIYTGQGKPIAAAYVDDRAVVCRPMRDDAYDFDRALAETRALCTGKPLGGQGSFSDGKSSEDDEGDIRLQIAHEGDNVRIDFGKSVAWFGFPKDEAIQFGLMILKHAGVNVCRG